MNLNNCKFGAKCLLQNGETVTYVINLGIDDIYEHLTIDKNGRPSYRRTNGAEYGSTSADHSRDIVSFINPAREPYIKSSPTCEYQICTQCNEIFIIDDEADEEYPSLCPECANLVANDAFII